MILWHFDSRGPNADDGDLFRNAVFWSRGGRRHLSLLLLPPVPLLGRDSAPLKLPRHGCARRVALAFCGSALSRTFRRQGPPPHGSKKKIKETFFFCSPCRGRRAKRATSPFFDLDQIAEKNGILLSPVELKPSSNVQIPVAGCSLRMSTNWEP